MILALVLAAAQPDPLAGGRLAVTDRERPDPNARYRIAVERGPDPTAKDRAIRDNGEKCAVVGNRRCPKRGRQLLSTPF